MNPQWEREQQEQFENRPQRRKVKVMEPEEVEPYTLSQSDLEFLKELGIQP